jgi:hypothetical protein
LLSACSQHATYAEQDTKEIILDSKKDTSDSLDDTYNKDTGGTSKEDNSSTAAWIIVGFTFMLGLM